MRIRSSETTGPIGREPSTPHELHARGLMTAEQAGHLIGLAPKTISNGLTTGRIPVSRVMQSPRIEPLIVWAIRYGVHDSEQLQQIAVFIMKNKASDTVVDDTVALIEKMLTTNVIPMPRSGRGRRKKSDDGPTGGAA